jgi:hypothetical protein
MMIDNEPLPKVRDALNKSNRRTVVESANKFPAGYSSVGFSLNSQNAKAVVNKNNFRSKKRLLKSF